MIVWGNIDETAKILMQTLLIIFSFTPLHSETLTIHCYFFDGSLKPHSWNTDDFVINIEHKCFHFFVLIWETLIIICCCVDVLLMLLWLNIIETAMIFLQLLVICYVFFVLISESIMFHCCFIDDTFTIVWKDIDEQWSFRCKQYWLEKTLRC